MSALSLSLAPSPRLAAIVVALHAAAASAALVSLGGLAGAALFAALLALGLAAAWSRALLAAPGSVRGLELSAEGVAVVLRSGERLQAPLPARRYVSRLAVALPLRGSVRRTILVVADMLPAESFRALRIWALWGRAPRAGVAEKQLSA